jgi:hypothetical protein
VLKDRERGSAHELCVQLLPIISCIPFVALARYVLLFRGGSHH